MSKVIAIGGGCNGGEFDSVLEEKIRHFIDKEEPNVVFIPYGSTDFEENFKDFKKIYTLLGCQVNLLQPGNERLLLEADLVYLGRGWTIPLVEKLIETKALPILVKASENGAVIAGFSAGAQALCTLAGSFEEEAGYTLVEGIGMIKGTIMSHYNYSERAEAYHKLLRGKNLAGIGLDDHTMLVVEDNVATLHSSKSDSHGYLIKSLDTQPPKRMMSGQKIKLPLLS
ncbi:Type 1 glutamine amidotransferase-like domain-containing protein [Mesobacillus subterraneus]|uniref:Type 1 glutamine amidotransferase-like domain-containing protein n=1 Tax=Mesobacillus subterraneus TaxID=285983 RepID=UPI001CFE0561|nr:Type 1 glutamine amidotransferase-like domain-containing protein [Mesobacillus subterraneus]